MNNSLAIAIVGAGGAGVISVGDLLLQAWTAEGGLGTLRKAFGPQIRGGEAAALVRLTEDELYTSATCFDVLVALNWNNYSRFEDEIRLRNDTLALCADGKEVPDIVRETRPDIREIDFSGLARAAHADGRPNMVALGVLGSLLGLPSQALTELAVSRLAQKAQSYQDAALACIEAGSAQTVVRPLAGPTRIGSDRWYISGNQAAAFGALHAGIRFAAAYPITPASDVLEWMADGLERLGGHLVQAEDELAAINMTLGAAYGGVPAMTATSGPGLALMMESIGLAVASETPVTILDVMRGGPSTGIPTKSEQSDLNIALHGLHGDAPHLVLAPLDIADCAFTTGWAVGLAQRLQTAAIVLSDQFIGQSTAAVAPPRLHDAAPAATRAAELETDYLRYRLTGSGVSTLAFPGDVDGRYTADGLEHNEEGTPSAKASDHHRQLDKRKSKLWQFDYGDDWAEISGPSGDIALVGFGSASLAMGEAAAALREQGLDVRQISLRLLMPLQREALADALRGCSRIFVVEQNHGAQLYRYLRSEMDFEAALSSLAIPGPVPLGSDMIVRAVQEGS